MYSMDCPQVPRPRAPPAVSALTFPPSSGGEMMFIGQTNRFYVRQSGGCTNNNKIHLKTNLAPPPSAVSSSRNSAGEGSQWPGGDRILPPFYVEQTTSNLCYLEVCEVPEIINTHQLKNEPCSPPRWHYPVQCRGRSSSVAGG